MGGLKAKLEVAGTRLIRDPGAFEDPNNCDAGTVNAIRPPLAIPVNALRNGNGVSRQQVGTRRRGASTNERSRIAEQVGGIPAAATCENGCEQ
jgi:hypothetical protein